MLKRTNSVILKLMTNKVIFNQTNYKIISLKNENIQYKTIFYSTITGTYSSLSFNNVNKKLVSKGIISLDNRSLSNIHINFLNTIYYPTINKFKLIGRHFKLKKKNKNFLVCSLNQSHKAYFLIKSRFVNLKLKPKKNKLLALSFLNFYSNRLVVDQLNKFRDLNKYTHKGIKSINLYKFKRKGKSTAI